MKGGGNMGVYDLIIKNLPYKEDKKQVWNMIKPALYEAVYMGLRG